MEGHEHVDISIEGGAEVLVEQRFDDEKKRMKRGGQSWTRVKMEDLTLVTTCLITR
jgi:hypothetical protein